jgi:hypothetical protein
MTANLDQFKNDLDSLMTLGDALHNSMQYDCAPDEFAKHVRKELGDQKTEELIKKLPSFKDTYEAWYSESLALLRQLLPDRLENFTSLYEKPKNRKALEYGNYVIQDYMQDLRVESYGRIKVDPTAAVPQFRQQLAILKAARARFESSLFEIRQIVQADLLDSEIDAARELLKSNFLRPAGAIAGVVLERHLRQVCEDHKIKVSKKHPSINDLNELLKTSSIIDQPQSRHIAMLGDIRNLCSHSKDKEPTPMQVGDLIDGVDKVIKTVA